MSELTKELFVEPTDEGARAGLKSYKKEKNPYLEFVESDGIPIYRGIGVRNVRELDLGDWDRMGARGAYLYLDGLNGIKGMYVLEVPGAGQTIPERHLFHEFYLVVEGYGTAETWLAGSTGKQVVEWQPGSLVYFPPNVMHRLVNATRDRALIIAANNAPPIWNVHRNHDFIFNNDYQFPEHYSPDADFYRHDDTLYQAPDNKRAQVRANFYPDIVNCALPLDNQRLPGYRRIQLAWRGLERDNGGFVSQYPPGRYSRAHHHGPGPVLVCLRGSGYTINWHRDLGPTPWKDGNGDKVRMIEYVPGGLVSAAPGGGDWFHQHFSTSREEFRVLNFWGGPFAVRGANGGEDNEGHVIKSSNLPMSEGGRSIGYSQEDPWVRATYEAALAKVGLRSQMPEELYTTD